MITLVNNKDLDLALEKCGYSIMKKGHLEKKISVGVLKGPSAPNFDSVGTRQNHIINIELIDASRGSRGGHAAGSQNIKMGRIDKFYQLCKDKKMKRGLLIFVQKEREDYIQKAMISRPKRLRKIKEFKRNLPCGEEIFKLIDAEIIPISYKESMEELYLKIKKCISSHGMPLS